MQMIYIASVKIKSSIKMYEILNQLTYLVKKLFKWMKLTDKEEMRDFISSTHQTIFKRMNPSIYQMYIAIWTHHHDRDHFRGKDICVAIM